MPDDLPTGNKAVYEFLILFALPFVFAAEEEFRAGKPPRVWLSWTVLAVVLFLLAIKWPKLKQVAGERLADTVERIAGFRMVIVLAVVAYIAATKNDPRYRYGAIAIGLTYLIASAMAYVRSLRRDLDMYVMPRRLTNRQALKMQQYLSKHEPHTVTVNVNPHDTESTIFASRILQTLKQARWDAQFSTAPPYAPQQGVYILTNGLNSIVQGGPDDWRPIIQEAFRLAHVDINGGGGAGAGEFSVAILIGRRPLIIGRSDPILVKLGRLMWAIGNMQRLGR